MFNVNVRLKNVCRLGMETRRAGYAPLSVGQSGESGSNGGGREGKEAKGGGRREGVSVGKAR